MFKIIFPWEGKAKFTIVGCNFSYSTFLSNFCFCYCCHTIKNISWLWSPTPHCYRNWYYLALRIRNQVEVEQIQVHQKNFCSENRTFRYSRFLSGIFLNLFQLCKSFGPLYCQIHCFTWWSHLLCVMALHPKIIYRKWWLSHILPHKKILYFRRKTVYILWANVYRILSICLNCIL